MLHSEAEHAVDCVSTENLGTRVCIMSSKSFKSWKQSSLKRSKSNFEAFACWKQMKI